MATKTVVTTKDYNFILVPRKVNAHIVIGDLTYCGLDSKIARHRFRHSANTELINICQTCLTEAGN